MRIFFISFILVGCTAPQPRQVRSEIQNEEPVLKPDTCKAFTGKVKKIPTYLPVGAAGFAVTRIMKSCITRDGEKGFEEGSPWTAMGVPCSAGGGEIDIRGHSYAPKMVSFSLATDCAMSPGSADLVSQMGKEALGLDDASKLLAYYPFQLQYWELDGYPDAGVGHVIELRSVESLSVGWKEMRASEQVLPVRLFGRENAWGQENQLFSISGHVEYQESGHFLLVVNQLDALSEQEVDEVRERCKALRPRRNCEQVF